MVPVRLGRADCVGVLNCNDRGEVGDKTSPSELGRPNYVEWFLKW